MKPGLLLLAVALPAAACASSHVRADGDDVDEVDAAVAADAAAGDGASADAAPDAGTGPDAAPAAVAPLLLSEVVLAPTGGELIELVNPTGAAVALGDYYLADAPSYFRLPAGGQTVDTSDFIVRFPAGAAIPAGGVVTVAVDAAAAFTAAYPGVTPSYSIAGATMTAVAVSGTPTLTNAGEPVVLFYWDGQSDRVIDVDIMIAGAPTAANALIAKSAVVVDGPDADTTGVAYASDAMTLPAQATAPGSALSTKRVALETAATESQGGGGNGVLGHDETSEQLGVTWDTSGYTAPTPGTVPAALTP